MTKENYGNTQFTLTYKRPHSIGEANNRLLKALGPVIKAGLDPHVWTEIGPKSLLVHHHGYITYTSAGQELKIRKFLYLWKQRNGFVTISEGPLERWHKYCCKDGSEINFERLVQERDEELLRDMELVLSMDDWCKYNDPSSTNTLFEHSVQTQNTDTESHLRYHLLPRTNIGPGSEVVVDDLNLAQGVDPDRREGATSWANFNQATSQRSSGLLGVESGSAPLSQGRRLISYDVWRDAPSL